VPVDGWHRQPTEHVTAVVAGAVHPALQVQLVKAALPAGELEFDGQAVQSDSASLPIVSRYFPGPQSRHVDEPLTTEYLPASHAMQSDSASLPIVSRYVPGGHSSQFAEPVAFLYFPASQPVHGVLATMLQEALKPS
jgi:hypothetical protein